MLSPKEGAAHPTPAEWKERVRVRLAELRWSQSRLARELSSIVETTPQAVSYALCAKAKQSSLRPFIDALLWLEAHEPNDDSAARNLFRLFDRLTDINKGRVLERIESLLRDQGNG